MVTQAWLLIYKYIKSYTQKGCLNCDQNIIEIKGISIFNDTHCFRAFCTSDGNPLIISAVRVFLVVLKKVDVVNIILKAGGTGNYVWVEETHMSENKISIC